MSPVKTPENEVAKRPKPKFVSVYNILPPQLRRRIKALKKISFETSVADAKFIEDVHKLEMKYMKSYSKLYKKREKIVRGVLEPTDSDCDFDDGTESLEENEENLAKFKTGLKPLEMNSKTKGIPGFWLTAFKNVDMLRGMITPKDEPILMHLYDVKVDLKEPLSFAVSFWFSSNPYFKNPVLTKSYELESVVESKSPWILQGPDLKASKGCQILWYEGKDVTQKSVLRRKRHKIHTEEVTVPCESFFNFFATLSMPEENDPVYEKAVCVRDMDYMLGVFFKEKLVPQAVLFYTGEAPTYHEQFENNIESKIRMSRNVNWLQLSNK